MVTKWMTALLIGLLSSSVFAKTPLAKRNAKDFESWNKSGNQVSRNGRYSEHQVNRGNQYGQRLQQSDRNWSREEPQQQQQQQQQQRQGDFWNDGNEQVSHQTVNSWAQSPAQVQAQASVSPLRNQAQTAQNWEQDTVQGQRDVNWNQDPVPSQEQISVSWEDPLSQERDQLLWNSDNNGGAMQDFGGPSSVTAQPTVQRGLNWNNPGSNQQSNVQQVGPQNNRDSGTNWREGRAEFANPEMVAQNQDQDYQDYDGAGQLAVQQEQNDVSGNWDEAAYFSDSAQDWAQEADRTNERWANSAAATGNQNDGQVGNWGNERMNYDAPANQPYVNPQTDSQNWGSSPSGQNMFQGGSLAQNVPSNTGIWANNANQRIAQNPVDYPSSGVKTVRSQSGRNWSGMGSGRAGVDQQGPAVAAERPAGVSSGGNWNSGAGQAISQQDISGVQVGTGSWASGVGQAVSQQDISGVQVGTGSWASGVGQAVSQQDVSGLRDGMGSWGSAAGQAVSQQDISGVQGSSGSWGSGIGQDVSGVRGSTGSWGSGTGQAISQQDISGVQGSTDSWGSGAGQAVNQQDISGAQGSTGSWGTGVGQAVAPQTGNSQAGKWGGGVKSARSPDSGSLGSAVGQVGNSEVSGWEAAAGQTTGSWDGQLRVTQPENWGSTGVQTTIDTGFGQAAGQTPQSGNWGSSTGPAGNQQGRNWGTTPDQGINQQGGFSGGADSQGVIQQGKIWGPGTEQVKVTDGGNWRSTGDSGAVTPTFPTFGTSAGQPDFYYGTTSGSSDQSSRGFDQGQQTGSGQVPENGLSGIRSTSVGGLGGFGTPETIPQEQKTVLPGSSIGDQNTGTTAASPVPSTRSSFPADTASGGNGISPASPDSGDVDRNRGSRGDDGIQAGRGTQRPQGNFKGDSFTGDRPGDDPSQWRLEDSIPGTQGQDYPNYSTIPKTSFKCKDHMNPGYYGDVEAQCQVFHICQANGRMDSFLCPLGTIFNQQYFVCDWWYNYNCEDTTNFYDLNANLYKSARNAGDRVKGSPLVSTRPAVQTTVQNVDFTENSIGDINVSGVTVPSVGGADGVKTVPTGGTQTDRPVQGGGNAGIGVKDGRWNGSRVKSPPLQSGRFTAGGNSQISNRAPEFSRVQVANQGVANPSPSWNPQAAQGENTPNTGVVVRQTSWDESSSAVQNRGWAVDNGQSYSWATRGATAQGSTFGNSARTAQDGSWSSAAESKDQARGRTDADSLKNAQSGGWSLPNANVQENNWSSSNRNSESLASEERRQEAPWVDNQSNKQQPKAADPSGPGAMSNNLMQPVSQRYQSSWQPLSSANQRAWSG